MTAPAPIQIPRADVRPASREPSPAAWNTGDAQGRSSGFAAHLAQEAPPASEGERPPASQPAHASTSAISTGAPADVATPTQEPGKAVPATRQILAAPLAAFRLLLGADGQAGDTSEGATAGEQPKADATADGPETALSLPIGLPLGALLPSPTPASPANTTGPSAAQTGQKAEVASPGAQRPTEVAQSVAAPTAPQAAQPAALAVANLVLERDASTFAGEGAQPDANAALQTQPAPTEAVARAQPSTLATLTGAPERLGTRKLRVESEAALPAAKSAILPDTAGALALAQPATTPPAATPAATTTASAPQPLSFDQLVDSIARARDGADQGGPVAVALRHGEFGRVSLRIESDSNGLSVAMASPDPAFAPAVAAAHAAAVAEPARTPVAEQRGASAEQNAAQGNGQSGNPSSQQRQPSAAQRPIANPAGSPTPRTERGGGIFA